MTNTVRPIILTSPAGVSAAPKIIETRRGDTIFVEAQWYCPQTGGLFHRGIVEERKVEK